MCGIAGVVGGATDAADLAAMAHALHHRGPDAAGHWQDADAGAALLHTRLRILDLSPAADGPMVSLDGRWVLVFNGEVYNHASLRASLPERPFRTRTDTEVVLACWERWGEAALDRLVGMFAFAIWDRQERALTLVRDRFGVKPLHHTILADGRLAFASEPAALRTAGAAPAPDAVAWATWLAHGRMPRGGRTWWSDVQAVPAGHLQVWREGRLTSRRWYDLPARVGPDRDRRSDDEVQEEAAALLATSVDLRFQADVPVGVCLSGGLDSSLLFALVHRQKGPEAPVAAFTFSCGDARYDETPWVETMLDTTPWSLHEVVLSPSDVPALASDVARHLDGPGGGIPTLAYGRLFEAARDAGVVVLLDGQGLDEQWGGYDTYASVARGAAAEAPLVQGSRSGPTRPGALLPDFAAQAETPAPDRAFPDALRAAQARDLLVTKLPRALRYNDRVSMRASRELREPFLDHRLAELALRQPAHRTHDGTQGKRLLRDLAADLLPDRIREAPKRPVQTPQREWLRGPLASWVRTQVEVACDHLAGAWLDRAVVERELTDYLDGAGDNAFFVWQWVELGLLTAMPTWRVPA